MLGRVVAASSPSLVVGPVAVVSVVPDVVELDVASSVVAVSSAVDGVVVLSPESAQAVTARAAAMASGATFERARDDMVHLGCFALAPDGASDVGTRGVAPAKPRR